jgi:hypothetical protein
MVVWAAYLKRLGESGLISGDLENAKASLKRGLAFFIVVIAVLGFEVAVL